VLVAFLVIIGLALMGSLAFVVYRITSRGKEVNDPEPAPLAIDKAPPPAPEETRGEDPLSNIILEQRIDVSQGEDPSEPQPSREDSDETFEIAI
jgi:hypothetical protein